MRLKSLTLEGFRTFSARQTVVFPRAPGLYAMRGDNQVDVNLQANDVGKSTILDAVVWGLYGHTTRGLRAGNVISWGAKSAFVEQTWATDGGDLAVGRRQNPNRVWVDGQDRGESGDSVVLTRFGLSSGEFLHSVLAGQFAPYFLDLGATEKLALFSDVLQLGYWGDRADHAKRLAGQLDSDLTVLTGRLERLTGEVAGLTRQREAVLADKISWSTKHRQRRQGDRKKVRELQAKLDRAQLVTEQCRCEHRELQRELRVLYKKMVDVGRDCDDVKAKLVSHRKSWELQSCPFCDRPMGDEWREKQQQHIRKLKQRYEQLQSDAVATNTAHDRCERQISRAEKKYVQASAKQQSLQERVRTKKRRLQEATVNPYAESLTELTRELKSLKSNLDEITSQHDQLATKHRRANYWVKGFRDLRLWVLDSTLAELEMRVNNSLSQLGLERWGLYFSIERETKSGGVTRGFNVDVRPPDSDEDCPWRNWGGGVTQRLKIAAEIGLGRLIADRKGMNLETEIWDEPTQHLSQQGVEDLLDHLHARSREERKQIWIVDHHVLQYPFDGVLLVQKTAEGSRMEMI
jgi:DNA repair exonuclease SbcCD ATPase subunit